MATVADYFATDFSLPFRVEAQWGAVDLHGVHHSFKSCVLLDFAANVRYLAFYFAAEISDTNLLLYVLDEHMRCLKPYGNFRFNNPSIPAGFDLQIALLSEQDVKLEYQWPGDLKKLRDEDLPFYRACVLLHRE